MVQERVNFDDLPTSTRPNINANSVPCNRREGSTPALDDQDIDAIVVFLSTLNDAGMMSAAVSAPAVAVPAATPRR